jgi:hypothetical protein
MEELKSIIGPDIQIYKKEDFDREYTQNYEM